MKPEQIIKDLKLKPLSIEGGSFNEIYRSAHGTSIYYLLRQGERSKWHKVKSDEIWYYHAGAPVLQLMIFPDGRLEQVIIGPNVAAGERPQNLIPGGVWQTAVLLPSSKDNWGLYGAAVFPAFEYEDFISGEDTEIEVEYPFLAEKVKKALNPVKKKRYLRTFLLCTLPWILIVLLAVVFWYRDSWPSTGDNIPHYEFRGVQLHNATYRITFSRSLVDFDVTEDEFRLLAAKFPIPAQEITKPERVSNMEFAKSSDIGFEQRYIWVNNGLSVFYQSPSGKGYKLVFDRNKNRGHYREKRVK